MLCVVTKRCYPQWHSSGHMQTPVPEAVLCFLCLHRLGQQQIKTWVKSGPCNIHTVIWIFCVAQTSMTVTGAWTPCTWRCALTLDQLHLLCVVTWYASHLQDPHAGCGSGCKVCYSIKKDSRPCLCEAGPGHSVLGLLHCKLWWSLYLPNWSCHCSPVPHHRASILMGFRMV